MNGGQTLESEKDLQQEVMKHAASTESLKSSIDHLSKEVIFKVHKQVRVITCPFFIYSSSHYSLD